MIALDTNILVHAQRRDASLHHEAANCIRRLAEGAHPWAICFHGLVEFYGVASQPRIWATPSTPEQIGDQIAAWRESPSLRILCDTIHDIESLMEIGKKAKVTGAMIHDARIATCCLNNGIRELWTVDRDFGRFSGLKTVNPLV